MEEIVAALLIEISILWMICDCALDGCESTVEPCVTSKDICDLFAYSDFN